MGNIASIVRRSKNIEFDEMLAAVTKVNNDLFGGSFTIITLSNNGLVVEFAGREFWAYWRRSPRTWGGKHGHGQFQHWCRYRFDSAIADILGNCIQKDEGLQGCWKSDSTKHPTYASWVKEETDNWTQTTDEEKIHYWNLALKSMPAGLTAFAGPLVFNP